MSLRTAVERARVIQEISRKESFSREYQREGGYYSEEGRCKNKEINDCSCG